MNKHLLPIITAPVADGETGRMAFAHEPSLVDVRYTQGAFDWLHLHLRLVPGATRVRHLDDAFATVREEVVAPPAVEIVCRISGVFCPFRDMIAWLEAIVIGVQECAWEIDGEGSWHRLSMRGDTLTVTGSGVAEEGEQVGGSRRQFVEAFYRGFREFVASPDYRPEPYEAFDPSDIAHGPPLLDLRSPLVEQWLAGSELLQASYRNADRPAARVIEAAAFAAERFGARLRRRAEPARYVDEALERARVLLQQGGCEDVGALVCALLHGVPRLTRTRDEEIARRFGAEIASIVRALSPWAGQGASRRRPGAARLPRAGQVVLLAEAVRRLDELCERAKRGAFRGPEDQAAADALRALVEAVRSANPRLGVTFDADWRRFEMARDGLLE